MSRFRLALAVGLSWATSTARANPVDVLVDNGPAGNRINMVVLGEGYKSSVADQDKLKSDAAAVVANIFNFTPYQEFKGLFNVKLVHTVSQTSAIPKLGVGSSATAFGCYYGCRGVNRLICCSGGSEGSVLSSAAANAPEVTVAVVIVNDQTYGGAGGTYAVVSTDESSVDIARHEIGHTLGDLADEYSDANPGFPECSTQTDCPEPNATLVAQSSGKWGQWVNAGTTIPTPTGSSSIGYLQGCRYKASGVYRPLDRCIMRELGRPFCSVCAEGLALGFWNLVEPIDSTVPPAETPLTTSDCMPQTFSAVVPYNVGSATAEWKVDGVVQASAALTLALDPRAVGAGPHSVELTLRNTSPLIRKDANMLASAMRTWAWTVNCGAATTDAGGDGHGDDDGGCCRVGSRHSSSGTGILGGFLALILWRRPRRT